MKKIIRFLIYPSVTFGSMTYCWLLTQKEYSPFISMLVPLVIANIIIFTLEQILPYERQWAPDLQSFKLNLTHTLMTSIIISPSMKALILWSFTRFKLSSAGLNIWPTELPVLVQILIAILFADLLIYGTHRWMHATKIGWRIHVIHHSTKNMHFLAGSRTHPLNSMIVYTTEVGLMLLLGIPTEILAVWTIYMSVTGLFSHCNIDLHCGVFNYFVSTADLHRVHHSPNWKLSNLNFGNSTCVWDLVFGTHYIPKKGIRQQGIQNHQIPEKYLDHLMAPFILERYKAKD